MDSENFGIDVEENSDVESTVDEVENTAELYIESKEGKSQLAKAFVEGNNSTVFETIVQKKTNKSIRSLNTFLTSNINFRTSKGDPKTNIIESVDKKTYTIPNEEMPQFFSLLEECRRDGCILNYQEKQNAESSGLMIDIDRYQSSPNREITERHLTLFAQSVVRIMNTVVDFSEHIENGEEFKIVVFFIQKPNPVIDRESKYAKQCADESGDSGGSSGGSKDVNTDSTDSAAPYKGPVYKDGFHMLIPEVMINRGAKRYLMGEMIKMGLMNNIFKGIDTRVQPLTEMLDTASSYVNVCFFGNTKGGIVAYRLTTILEITLSPDMLGDGVVCNSRKLQHDEFANYNMLYELSLSFYFEKMLVPTTSTKLPQQRGRKKAADMESAATERKMMGFGITEDNQTPTPTRLKKMHFKYRKELELKILHLVETSRGRGISDADAENTRNDMSVLTLHDPVAAMIKSHLSLLDSRFARDYEMWRNVIFALAHTSSSYKPLAEWFSQRVPNSWNREGLDKIWNEGISRARTVSTPVTKNYIKHWARMCNKDKFKEIDDASHVGILQIAATNYDGVIQHAVVAKILHAMLNEKFVTDIENKENKSYKYCWYEFVLPNQKHIRGEVYKWRKEYEPSVLHIYIADKLPRIYEDVQRYIDGKKDAADSDGLTKYWTNFSKTFKTYTAKLSEDSFQNGIIKQAKYRFLERGFIDKLDSYEDIIGVGNGVLRVGPEPKLFTGYHEYKISKFTETNYVPFSIDNPWMGMIDKIYRDLYPEPDVQHWMKMWDSQSVEPREADSAVLFWVGGGSNGKSSKVSFISKSLGKQYSCKIPITLLTSSYEDAGNANSAYAMMEGKTHARFTEPNRLMNLNTGRLKEMFGGEDQTSRELYGNQKNWEMKATPTIVSNWDFNTDCTDDGFWRRCYYYKSKIKFVQNPNPNNKFEVKKDERFIREYKKDPRFHEAMLSYMVENNKIFHKKYGGNIERVPCPTIRKETEQWRNRQDTINRFITQRIVKVIAMQPVDVDGNHYGEVFVPEYPLNIIASKYSEWYSENIGKKYNDDISSIIMQFENSCLAGSLVRQNDGSSILKGHRIRESASDPIRENECLIGSFLEKKEIVAAITSMEDPENNILKIKASAGGDILPPDEIPDELAPRTDTNNPDILTPPETDQQSETVSNYDYSDVYPKFTEFDAIEKNAIYPLQGEGKIPEDVPADGIKKLDKIIVRKSAAEDYAEKKSKLARLGDLLKQDTD